MPEPSYVRHHIPGDAGSTWLPGEEPGVPWRAWVGALLATLVLAVAVVLVALWIGEQAATLMDTPVTKPRMSTPQPMPVPPWVNDGGEGG